MSIAFDPGRVTIPEAHFIDGARVSGTGDALPVARPSDAERYASCPVADADLVDRAVVAAKAAQRRSGWGAAAPRERARVLHAWARRIGERAEDLARLESLGSTRPIAQARATDVPYLVDTIRFYAEFADKVPGEVVPTAGDQLGMILHEPYGVVAAITPWNFPLTMAGWKLAPALAAGNAVVLKPSELTPFSAVLLAELALEAGLPAGLLNVVQGDGPTTGAALTAHPDVGKISFTGSTRAGIEIMRSSAAHGLKPVTLELGGKSPQVVFADADLDLAAECVVRAITLNAGQVCVAGSRLVVAAGVAARLAETVAARFAAVRPGPTWDAASAYSPIVSARQLAQVDRIVAEAREAGGRVLAGGRPMQAPGWFYEPTLIDRVEPDSPAVRSEIFGPVLTLQTFEGEEEAVALANHETYGLAAGVYTRDLSRALRMTKRIEAGTVWVNRYGRSFDHILPTGGFKSSGIGKDLGRAAFEANLRAKSVLMAI